MTIITTASFAKALWPGINKWYGRAYEEWPTEYTELFDVQKSNRAYEEQVGTTGFGLAAVKGEGNSISYDDESQAYVTRYSHLVYALGFIITREMFEDDLYDLVGKRKAEALAFSLRQTQETVGANVYNRAFTSTYAGGDGKELCATDHPNFAGGTWSNELATAADLSEGSLEQACIDIAGFTNDRGLKIRVMPDKLIIPKELMFEAERILNSIGRSGTADNDLNALKSMGKFRTVIVNHYLTDTDAWFIRNTIPGNTGMICWDRRGAEFAIDNDFDTENAKYKATQRYSMGWTDPRGLYGSPGA
jgi:hypothetical protein